MKHLHRSQNKMFSGVIAGFAEYFGWDIALARVGYAAIAMFTGFFPCLLIYIVAAIVVPEE